MSKLQAHELAKGLGRQNKEVTEIDKNNKGIQSMLTWKLAKDVMKDKQLRRMYYEKYGEKYKVKKEKRWWERG